MAWSSRAQIYPTPLSGKKLVPIIYGGPVLIRVNNREGTKLLILLLIARQNPLSTGSPKRF